MWNQALDFEPFDIIKNDKQTNKLIAKFQKTNAVNLFRGVTCLGVLVTPPSPMPSLGILK